MSVLSNASLSSLWLLLELEADSFGCSTSSSTELSTTETRPSASSDLMRLAATPVSACSEDKFSDCRPSPKISDGEPDGLAAHRLRKPLNCSVLKSPHFSLSSGQLPVLDANMILVWIWPATLTLTELAMELTGPRAAQLLRWS
jgi:hypothetical protein